MFFNTHKIVIYFNQNFIRYSSIIPVSVNMNGRTIIYKNHNYNYLRTFVHLFKTDNNGNLFYNFYFRRNQNVTIP